MLTNIFRDIFSLFYPNTCTLCSENLSYHETIICTFCLHDLPFTHYTTKANNPVEKAFFGRIKLDAATALLFFQKNGKTQNLIHALKYKGKESIGELLGQLTANKILSSTRFDNIDCIIPVPIHKEKEKIRGYNQLYLFGKTLAKEMQIAFYPNLLFKTSKSETQTRKQRYDRWINVNNSFSLLDSEKLKNKHVLLIDDIITTGATLEACSSELLKIDGLKLSLAAIAYTEQ